MNGNRPSIMNGIEENEKNGNLQNTKSQPAIDLQLNSQSEIDWRYDLN